MPILLDDPSAAEGVVLWIDAAGVQHALTDDAQDVHQLVGIRGDNLPPIEIVRSEVPYIAGSRIRRVRTREREIQIPLFLESDSPANLAILKRQLWQWFWPGEVEGDEVQYGYLRITGQDAVVRQIPAIYLEGLEGDDAERNVTSEDVVVSLLCPQPYFEAVSDTVVTFTTGGAALTWFDRTWFPFYLTSDALIDSQTVDNDGDLEAWPIWTLTGPAVNPVFRNLTTGAILTVPTSVPAGGTLTVDTRPGFKRVVNQSGTSVYGLLTSGSTLWSLRRGGNDVSVSAGSTTAATGLAMNYRKRYLSA